MAQSYNEKLREAMRNTIQEQNATIKKQNEIIKQQNEIIKQQNAAKRINKEELI